MSHGSSAMRIGELAQRVGVSTHVLRSWERRYGLLDPIRTASGYRVYGADSERRVRAVLALREDGVPAAEAVARVLATSRLGAGSGDLVAADHRSAEVGFGDAGSAEPTAAIRTSDTGTGVATEVDLDPGEAVNALKAAVEDFDERAAQAVLDRVHDQLPLEAVVCEVILPFLRDLGARWERGETTIAHEHFASQLLRRRLSTHTMAWTVGSGPLAVLACPARERHDLGLLCFAVLLGHVGWRIRFLGADTPTSALSAACQGTGVDLVVVSATRATAIEAQSRGLRRIAADRRLVIGGTGATEAVAAAIGVHRLPADLREAVRFANAQVLGVPLPERAHPVTAMEVRP